MEFPTADTHKSIESLDRELRAASFLTRDRAGNYTFACNPLYEYFTARAIARRLRTGDTDALDLPPLDATTLALTADMLPTLPFKPESAAAEIRTLQTNNTRKRYADNLSAFLQAWEKNK